jgi:hypothetical protein
MSMHRSLHFESKVQPARLAAQAAASATAAVALVLLSACASAPAPTQPAVVPDAIRAAAGERPGFVLFARGVQIYRCDATAGGAVAWTFVAPEAQLFESSKASHVLGTHGAGPFWQANDGSRTVGTVKARAPAANAADIPWLLLATTPSGAAGRMAAVSSIQRIHTQGGVAPGTGCAAAADVGKSVRVPYTSDYVFFVAR